MREVLGAVGAAVAEVPVEVAEAGAVTVAVTVSGS